MAVLRYVVFYPARPSGRLTAGFRRRPLDKKFKNMAMGLMRVHQARLRSQHSRTSLSEARCCHKPPVCCRTSQDCRHCNMYSRLPTSQPLSPLNSGRITSMLSSCNPIFSERLATNGSAKLSLDSTTPLYTG
ncbi:hypothetical protein E2C01_082387 [Portunus trituberculatus]|uniref:Uncharacterized protein n=1 Tax=Portunus trituberculatus TaxID=210409 RepID=A0A5B7IZ42_PORTR|nr:hypothetical protein [Portunus trituberculatus]